MYSDLEPACPLEHLITTHLQPLCRVYPLNECYVLIEDYVLSKVTTIRVNDEKAKGRAGEIRRPRFWLRPTVVSYCKHSTLVLEDRGNDTTDQGL